MNKELLWGLQPCDDQSQVFVICVNLVHSLERRFGYNGRNDETDAFRHCMWSGLISKRISHSEAMKFTTMHEMQDGNDFAEKSMDLHNNKVGAEIGQNVGSERSIADECYKALQHGKLKFY